MKQLYIKLGTRAKSSLNRDFYVLFSTFFPNQAEIMIWMENWWFENGSPIFQYGAYVRIIKTLWSHIKYFFIRETFDQYVVEEITINTLTPTKAIRINKGQLISKANFSFESKNQRKYFCISALASKSGQIKKI